jgi:hypothetical protein
LYVWIVAASGPRLEARAIAAIDEAYFPAIGSLHSLLDSLVDTAEDAATGQLRLIDCYSSVPDAAARMASLAGSALAAARALPHVRTHELLVAAMACSYLSSVEPATDELAMIARDTRAAMGWRATPLLVVFSVRRLAGALRGAPALPAMSGTVGASRTASARTQAEAREPGADARAA